MAIFRHNNLIPGGGGEGYPVKLEWVGAAKVLKPSPYLTVKDSKIEGLFKAQTRVLPTAILANKERESYLGITTGSQRDHNGITTGSQRDHNGITTGSQRDHNGITTGSQRDHNTKK